ncbi:MULTISPECIES: GntR family transcriptional regulator [Streptomyces]|uniref:Transcriptional regulator, GntR family n=1 Tax=Streptomyces venezuelae (strain ATCC 10712 / CBS 650.69 / DSM 40230 / JCM 4526 / NBRC 13096 / PD 04745) TaxID=953739 RepID=F2R8U1_STRVP|nr:GntR family transcriptional regulator [Streptomyces venezuelae]APE22249.1 GntR family transcriptional regulator [Streptomyces venezuelae]QER99632.1 GntR family transcriptional regulator [Streptomyces venezuelae ATCC 10712]CCA56401.1 transcriptional regulator, GntR family [Streptomyces venezuelae ATCC 10712]
MAREFKDTRSPHQKIAAELRRRITRGDLPPGSKLGSTAELMEQYGGVANTTVQKALQALKAEGLLEGLPGRGVYVRQHVQQSVEPIAYMKPAGPGEPYPWMSEAAKRERAGAIRLLDVEVVVPPAEVAEALRLEDGGRAVLRKQLLLLDEEPTELTRSYYPLSLVEGTAVLERKRIRGGTPALLDSLGFPPREFVDELSSEIPTEEEVVALELPKDMPVLVAFRVVYSDGGRPIEATLMTKAAHRYRMRYRLPVT